MAESDDDKKDRNKKNQDDASNSTPALDSHGSALPPALNFEQLVKAGTQTLYEQAYQELCLPVTGEEPTDVIPPEEEFIEAVKAFLENNPQYFYMKAQVCFEFEYCERMKKIRNTQSLLQEIAAFAAFCGIVGIGSWIVALWGLQTKLFDWMCEC